MFMVRKYRSSLDQWASWLEVTRALVYLYTTRVLIFSFNTVIAWYKTIINIWDMIIKTSLLFASRAYILHWLELATTKFVGIVVPSSARPPLVFVCEEPHICFPLSDDGGIQAMSLWGIVFGVGHGWRVQWYVGGDGRAAYSCMEFSTEVSSHAWASCAMLGHSCFHQVLRTMDLPRGFKLCQQEGLGGMVLHFTGLRPCHA